MSDLKFGRRWTHASLPYAILRLGGQAAEFAAWVLFARALEPSRFGELSVAFLVCRYIGLVADWGAIARGPREAAGLTPDRVHDLVRHRNRMTLGLTVLTAIVFVALGFAQLIPLTVVIIRLGFARDWIALGRERGGRSGLPQFLQGSILLACAAIGAHDLTRSAAAIALGYGAATVLSVLLNRLPGRVPNSKAKMPDAWILLGYLGIQALSALDTVLLALIRDSAEAGIYAAVYRIPNALISLLTVGVGTLLPIATGALQTATSAFSEIRMKAMRASLAVAIAILVATPVAAVLVPVLFGPAYRSGQLTAAILMIATAVIAWSAPLHPLALARGNDRRYAGIVCSGAGFNLIANLILIPFAGTVGAAVATLLAQVAVAAWLWIDVRHVDHGLSGTQGS